MGIIMDINTLTLNGQTKLFFTNNSGDLKVAVSDTNGFVGYTTKTLNTGGDENLPYDGNIYSSSDSYRTTVLRNRNYFIRANENFIGASEVFLYLENPTQTTLLGDKVRITNLTFGGNPPLITPLVLDVSTGQELNSTRWIVNNQNDFASNQSDIFSGYKTMQGCGNEYTLLYSPTGACKNGVRLTVTYTTSPPLPFQSSTYTSTDYLWYRTKAVHLRLDWFISTGTPPTPGGGVVDPGTGGGPGPGTGGGGTGWF